MKFFREVNTWVMQEPEKGETIESIPPRRERYVPAKWVVTGTPWERSPDGFASALQTIESPDRSQPNNSYYSLRHDNIIRLAKAFENHLKQALTEEAGADNSNALQIIDEIRSIVHLFMIRRTDNSHIRSHTVVKHPKCTLAWAEFTTPAKLVKQIDIFRKQVSKYERENYVNAMKKWEFANTNKPANQSSQQPTAPLDINRKKAPSMR